MPDDIDGISFPGEMSTQPGSSTPTPEYGAPPVAISSTTRTPGLCPPCRRGDCGECMQVDHPDMPNMYTCPCTHGGGRCPRPAGGYGADEIGGHDYGMPSL